MESQQQKIIKPNFVHHGRIRYELPKDKLPDDLQFWYVETKESNDEIREIYKFSYIGLNNFLKHIQVGRCYNLRDEIIFIHAKDNIVTQIKAQDIKDVIVSVAKQLGDSGLEEMILRGAPAYLSETKLDNADFMELTFLESNSKRQYLFFSNSVVEIQKNLIQQKTYQELEGYVWQDSITKNKANITEPVCKVIKTDNTFHLEVQDSIKDSDYWRYLELTSFYHWRKVEERKSLAPKDQHTKEEKHQQNMGIMAKLSALGYMLCSYKDPASSKAVICMDAKMSEVGDSNGRTGKSIFAKSIEKMLKTYYINGRDTKIFEGAHPYDGLDESYKMVLIDDADQNLQFGLFYTLITGDMQVNTKNAVKFTIPFARSPKLIITTNHAVRGSGSSDLARQFLVGFADYFSDTRSPSDVFNRRLFDDWDFKQWNSFYEICASAIQIYLQHGFIEADTENLALRRLRQEIGENFIAWAETFFNPNDDIPLNIGIEVGKQYAYEDFERMFETYVRKNVNIRLFKKKLQQYAQFKGWAYNAKTHGEDIKTNGKEYFQMDLKK